jgi:hypothetical protein
MFFLRCPLLPQPVNKGYIRSAVVWLNERAESKFAKAHAFFAARGQNRIVQIFRRPVAGQSRLVMRRLRLSGIAPGRRYRGQRAAHLGAPLGRVDRGVAPAGPGYVDRSWCPGSGR